MCWKIRWILVGLAVLTACRAEREPPTAEALAYHNPGALIEAEELLAAGDRPHLRPVDFRRREAFDKGHIPGAIPIWRPDIEDRDHPVPGMMAPKQRLEALFSSLGLRDQDTLVVYDDHAACESARLWWVLRVHGFDQVRLLNGGLKAWLKAGGELSDQYTPWPPTAFKLPEIGNLDTWIGLDSVWAGLGFGDRTLIDARTADEFSGVKMTEGAARAGRIPGSIHTDWAASTYYHEDGKFRRPEELRAIYGYLPTGNDHLIIAYCHSGVRSAHTCFVLKELMGYPHVANYDGSWLEWSRRTDLPAERDNSDQNGPEHGR